MKTIHVKYPPQNNPQSYSQAQAAMEKRIDELIKPEDREEYEELRNKLEESQNPAERAEILRKLDHLISS